MFEKSRLKKEIKDAKARIELFEKRRSRSQAALVEAILAKSTPNDSDVEYFNHYTELIEAERSKMHEYETKLEALS